MKPLIRQGEGTIMPSRFGCSMHRKLIPQLIAQDESKSQLYSMEPQFDAQKKRSPLGRKTVSGNAPAASANAVRAASREYAATARHSWRGVARRPVPAAAQTAAAPHCRQGTCTSSKSSQDSGKLS